MQVTPRLDGGGVEQATLDMAAAVARAGRRSLVASHGGRLEGALARSGAALIRLPVQSKNPLIVAGNAARLAGVIARHKVSLVHVRSRAPAFAALMAARSSGVPMVATYHGIYDAGSPLKRWYNSIMIRGVVTIANSAFTRDHVIAQHALAAANVVVVPEGIDTARFDPAAVSQERVAVVRAAWGLARSDRRTLILLAARMTDWKGQRLAVEALGRVAGRDGIVLILAGAGEGSDYAASIEVAAALAGISDNVRLVGPCDDMPAAFLAADLVIAPSTKAESFGRSVVEAAAMGAPVLASRLGAHAETVVHGQTGWLVAAGDPDAWTRAIGAALAIGADARTAMGAAARARVERLYSLDTMCEGTFEVYRRVLEGRP
ncbi:MAG: glycosyltransferase [Pseudomonadota bacterium]|nr:glycosyltransferase [Pseudomonadota bacterium]